MLQGFAAINKRLSSGGVLTGTMHGKCMGKGTKPGHTFSLKSINAKWDQHFILFQAVVRHPKQQGFHR